MTNGFDTTQGLPSQRDAGWWSKVKSALEGSPIYPKKGKADYGMWGSILGRGAQAISARDPKSWQYQMGGLGAEIGQAHKMALTAEAEKKRKEEFRKMIIKALGLNVPVPGEVEEEPKVGSGSGLGSMEEQDLIEMFLGR